MAIKELSKVYQISDGRMFASREDAERHEEIGKMLQAINQAKHDAEFDDFGPTKPRDYDRRLAEELIRAGFRMIDRIT